MLTEFQALVIPSMESELDMIPVKWILWSSREDLGLSKNSKGWDVFTVGKLSAWEHPAGASGVVWVLVSGDSEM